MGKHHNACMRASGEIVVGDGHDAFHQDCKPDEEAMLWTFVPSTTSPGYYQAKNAKTATCLTFSSKYEVARVDDGETKTQKNVYHLKCKDSDSSALRGLCQL